MLDRVSTVYPPSPAPRFGSIIPIASVTNVAKNETYAINDPNHHMYVSLGVDALERLLANKAPYKYAHPEMAPTRDEGTLNQLCYGIREKVLKRLGLIDSDYANDDKKRAAVLSTGDGSGQYMLLTGEDAQATLDAEALLDQSVAIRDNPTRATELNSQAGDMFAREQQRLKSVTPSPRQLNIHVTSLPNAEDEMTNLGYRVRGIIPALVSDLTVS